MSEVFNSKDLDFLLKRIPEGPLSCILSFRTFTPKTRVELLCAVTEWCEERKKAIEKYGHINDWDTSMITDMSSLFYNIDEFNDNIGNWDVSNVTNMSNMFHGACSFNQYIGDWDVSNVTDMSFMFTKAHTFNQYIGDWDVSNVTFFYQIFHKAYAFNQPIGNWT